MFHSTRLSYLRDGVFNVLEISGMQCSRQCCEFLNMQHEPWTWQKRPEDGLTSLAHTHTSFVFWWIRNTLSLFLLPLFSSAFSSTFALPHHVSQPCSHKTNIQASILSKQPCPTTSMRSRRTGESLDRRMCTQISVQR
jgi:hypothetical protein